MWDTPALCGTVGNPEAAAHMVSCSTCEAQVLQDLLEEVTVVTCKGKGADFCRPFFISFLFGLSV